jgi:hypothetical protein
MIKPRQACEKDALGHVTLPKFTRCVSGRQVRSSAVSTQADEGSYMKRRDTKTSYETWGMLSDG